MKVAIVYNRESQRVINLFGVPNREKYGLKSIKRIVDALRSGGHQVQTFEGDKDLIVSLERFMPRVIKGERPGMVFNLSYGIQGQARYTHIPGLLEMLGVPYVGSGPLAHALALDKVVAKMIFKQNDLPTPEFIVLDSTESQIPEDLPYPMIVKPKSEAVSFGIRVVDNASELRDAAAVIFEQFEQPVLAEQYIDGRELNVGILGNRPPEPFQPVELEFGDGPKIYTLEDKKGTSGREVTLHCPARVSPEVIKQAQDLAKRAFTALGCLDCCRVDMRLDSDDRLYLLEINSLPSLGARGSYVHGAAQAGLDFAGLVNRLVEIASARYFGMPHPPQFAPKSRDAGEQVFRFLTERRDRLERRVKKWTTMSSRSGDPIGIRAAASELSRHMRDIGMLVVDGATDGRSTWCWQTGLGMDGGTLLLAHVDVPLDLAFSAQPFRREPEWLMGEGVASSRAPLVQLEYVLRAVRSARLLQKRKIGVLVYGDEGRDVDDSEEIIRAVAARAARVLVLRPGTGTDSVVADRRGHRKLRLVAEARPRALGRQRGRQDVLRWVSSFLEDLTAMTEADRRLTVATTELKTTGFPMMLPHRVETTILIASAEPAVANETENKIRQLLDKKFRWQLSVLSNRPPLVRRKVSMHLVEQLQQLAQKWEIPLHHESSMWPSVGGLAPESIPVVCGMGPVGRDLYTPQESVSRTSLLQRTLLLAEFLTTVSE